MWSNSDWRVVDLKVSQTTPRKDDGVWVETKKKKESGFDSGGKKQRMVGCWKGGQCTVSFTLPLSNRIFLNTLAMLYARVDRYVQRLDSVGWHTYLS